MNESGKKTILMADDTPDSLDVLSRLFKGHDIIGAGSRTDCLNVLKEKTVDLMLLDMCMSGMDSCGVCREIKASPVVRDIPVMFIIDRFEGGLIEKAFDAGGADYVVKPFTPKELLSRIHGQIRLREINQELKFVTTRDSLTGIYNRKKFFELGEKMLAHSTEGLYAFIIDIDHFKRINDEYGHQTGDHVLKKITLAISEILPDDALFGRMGGEEFAILFRAGTKDQAVKIADQIHQAVAVSRIAAGSSQIISCSISGGISCSMAETPTLDSLLKKAGQALYRAKDTGRNQSIFRNS